jgi:hypothetical protein
MINEQHAHLFCKDDISKIENYELAKNDTTQTWDCHHRLELTLDGEFAHIPKELMRLGMYFHRPYFELIFLTNAEHHRVHHKGKTISVEQRQKISKANKGRLHSEEEKQKISASVKGKNHPLYGKHCSAETRHKISIAKKGKNKGRQHSEETRRKISDAKKEYWARRRQEKLNVKE